MSISIATIFAVILIVILEGFFSGSELALLSCDRLFLRRKAKSGNKGAQLALKLQDSSEKILSTTLIVTSSCVMAITVLTTLESRRLFGEGGEKYAIFLASGTVIIFGELLPKLLFRRKATTFAPIVAIPIYYFQIAISPFTRLVSAYTKQLERVARPIEALWSGKRSPKDELQGLLSQETKNTNIRSHERKMIRKILKFREVAAKDALLPLVQVDAIEKTATVAAAIEEFDRHRHSRMPVYDERVDNVVGVIELTSLMRAPDLLVPIDQYVQTAHFSSDSQKLSEVWKDMNESNSKMNVIVDEYGGALGILTREDIVEQIVGDLQDEDDPESRDYRQISENKWSAKGSCPINQLNDALKIELPEGDYDTLAGFLLRQFGRIPEQGDEVYYATKSGQIHFQIRSASAKRIESIVITRITR